VILDHLATGGLQFHHARVIEAVELVALDLFNTGQRQITLADYF